MLAVLKNGWKNQESIFQDMLRNYGCLKKRTLGVTESKELLLTTLKLLQDATVEQERLSKSYISLLKDLDFKQIKYALPQFGDFHEIGWAIRLKTKKLMTELKKIERILEQPECAQPEYPMDQEKIDVVLQQRMESSDMY